MSGLLLGILNGLILAAIIGSVKVILNYLKKIKNTIEYVDLKQEAIDYALEKSIGNGYSQHREEKLKELIEKREIIKE